MGVGPFPKRGLDEALGLSICLGGIGLGADVLDGQLLAGVAEGVSLVATALSVMTRVTVMPRHL